MSSKATIEEAHVLMFPFHVQGHLPPMLDLAKLLSTFGLYVTVLESNFYNIPVHVPHSLQQLPNLRLLKLHGSGHQENVRKPFTDIIDEEESRRVRCKDEYRRLLGSVQGWPPVTCVVADGFVLPALDVPEEMGIPIFILRTSSACSVWAYFNIPQLIDSKEFPFLQDEDDMDKEIHSIPGMEGILRRRDLPSFIRNSKSTNDKVLQFLITISENLHRATGLLFNTVEAVEGHVLSHIRSIFPVTYSIGPLHKLNNTLNDVSNKVERKDEIAWLDMQSSKSVVYASFGSTAKMSKDELLEFWHGLTNSGYPFLWVIRKGLVIGDAVESEKIIQGLKDEIKELRGCIVEWAPQQDVLAHEAVGCFLTHSGWNSTMESILAGVPMVSWPFWGDQMPNSRFVSEVWKIGVDMKDMTGRSIVEKMIREVMEGEKAKEMRESAKALQKLTAESYEEEGSSSLNLKALVKHIKSLSANPLKA